ncbi:kinase-like protein [Schizopora paradoxa]|uniref:Kinase-like protein n=1 Tax=Schizopora paradoxa TaxID=27342 RepID=A0A0H2RPD3_9AGAM|nr:kinase-like protein [Schizopora paradoxa]
MGFSNLEKSERIKKVIEEFPELDLTGFVLVDETIRNHGSSCDLYKGYCNRNKKYVAVKRIRTFHIQDELLVKRLCREIAIWAKIKHKNVLPFLGFFIDNQGRFNLVSEWMGNGNLHEYMPELEKGVKTLRMLAGIAEGLSYLHSEDIIHADLKSLNVMVSPSGEAQIADFGLSHLCSSSISGLQATTNPTVPKGSPYWMARELFDFPADTDTIEVPVPNKKSDVWAFGMVIYELLSRDMPYSHVRDKNQVMMYIYQGRLPKKPAGIDTLSDNELNYEKQLWDLCKSCWAQEPKDRPTMDLMCLWVKKLINEVEVQVLQVNDVNYNGIHTSQNNQSEISITHYEEPTEKSMPLEYVTPELNLPPTGSPFRERIEVLQRVPQATTSLSEVFAGELHDKSGLLKVAVKKMRKLASTERKEVERIVKEARKWSEEVRHENVVPVLGCFIGADEYLNVISEWMVNGTLADYKEHVTRGEGTLKMIYGIAHGLFFLHCCGIVHSDLSTHSVYVSQNGDPKLSGFTDSRIASTTEVEMSTLPSSRSSRWMSIEQIPNDTTMSVAGPSKESDVWSFGMTIFVCIYLS